MAELAQGEDGAYVNVLGVAEGPRRRLLNQSLPSAAQAAGSRGGARPLAYGVPAASWSLRPMASAVSASPSAISVPM
jgi:hypothetical protein